MCAYVLKYGTLVSNNDNQQQEKKKQAKIYCTMVTGLVNLVDTRIYTHIYVPVYVFALFFEITFTCVGVGGILYSSSRLVMAKCKNPKNFQH